MAWLNHCKASDHRRLGVLATALAVVFIATAAPSLAVAGDAVLADRPAATDAPAAAADGNAFVPLETEGADASTLESEASTVDETLTGTSADDDLNMNMMSPGGGHCPHSKRALAPTS